MSAKEMVQIPREVLEKIQWQEHEDRSQTCCICSGVRNYILNIGHKEDCPIGIALKQEAVSVQHEEAESVQYEMVVDENKYVTILGVDKGKKISCRWCDFLEEEDSECHNPAKSGCIHATCCHARYSPDKLNRIWKKVIE